MTAQQRIEASARGRAAISLLIAAILVGVAICALPDSALRRDLVGRAAPALNAVGLDQRWDLFAPDPRRTSIDLVAHVSLSDGSVERWLVPRRDELAGAYSDYRWRKLAEQAIVRGGDPVLVRRLGAWIARERTEPDRSALQVQLVARFAALAPPGSDAGRALAFTERTLTTLRAPAPPGPPDRR